jgi:hypothetical protein
MATHHVSLRRFCPNLNRRLTPSPGECDLKRNPAQAERTRPKHASAFTRGSDLPRNPQNTIGLGKVQVACQVILAQAGETGNIGWTVVIRSRHPVFISTSQGEGISPLEAGMSV